MAGAPTFQLTPPLTRAQLDAEFNRASPTYKPWIQRIKFKTYFPASPPIVWLENYIVTLPSQPIIPSNYDNNYYLAIGNDYYVRISFPKLVQGIEGEGLYINLAKKNFLYLGGYQDIYGASNSTALNAALAQYKLYLKTNFPPSPSSIGTQVATTYKNTLNFELLGASTGQSGASALPFKVILEYKEQGTAGGGGQTNTSTISN